MTADLSIEFESVEALSARLATAATSIAALLETRDREVATLRGQWTGEASAAYAAAHDSWTIDLRNINALLTEVSSTVAAAHTGYTAAENGNAQRWS